MKAKQSEGTLFYKRQNLYLENPKKISWNNRSNVKRSIIKKISPLKSVKAIKALNLLKESERKKIVTNFLFYTLREDTAREIISKYENERKKLDNKVKKGSSKKIDNYLITLFPKIVMDLDYLRSSTIAKKLFKKLIRSKKPKLVKELIEKNRFSEREILKQMYQRGMVIEENKDFDKDFSTHFRSKKKKIDFPFYEVPRGFDNIALVINPYHLKEYKRGVAS